MKRVLTISLLFFFLADAVGFILYLLVDWYEVRKEMTHLLASEELDKNAVTLTLDQKEFEKITWIETNAEFYYKGKLYDLSSLTQSFDGKSILRCIEDQREAELFKNMELMVDHDQSNPNHESTVILSIFKFLSGLVFHLISFPLQQDGIRSGSGDAYVNHYQFSFLSTTVQPPNFI